MYLQGFARHPGLVKPHWYIGSLQATQGEALKASLVTAGVPAENITWVEGVTPAAIERGNWSMPGKGTSSERGCTMAHLRMIKTAYDAGHATAVMLEGDASLRLMGLWGRPVALGEKGQTKRGVQSAGIHLADVYAELEKSPWDICQLCLLTMTQKDLTMTQKDRDLLKIVQPLHSAMAKGDIIVYRNPRTYSQAYGTAAYTVSRAGMARILNSYLAGGETGQRTPRCLEARASRHTRIEPCPQTSSCTIRRGASLKPSCRRGRYSTPRPSTRTFTRSTRLPMPNRTSC